MKKKELFEMTTKEIFEKTNGNDIEQMFKDYITALVNDDMEKATQIQQILIIKNKCPHEILFKYTDNSFQNKDVVDIYFCPVCERTITIEHCRANELKWMLEYSRVIPLTNLSLLETDEFYRTIRNEVYENLDYYYNTNIPIEELSSKMEEKLVKLQTQYEKPTKKLKKILK